ncbi:MAG: hypothetical protein R3D30_07530 [Hyphomicrobiales bacterium]
MSGASDILDPVAAARDDIHRSKDLIASSLDDLRQHHLWLEDYHRAERRRVQRLHRQEVLHQLERKRRRTMGTVRRAALISFFMARAVIAFLVKHGTAFAIATYRLTVRAVRWTAPRTVALTHFLLKELAAGLAWSWTTGRHLAREGFKHSVVALSWTVRMSDVAGVTFRKQLSEKFAAVSAKAAPLMQPIRAKAAVASAQTRRWSKRSAHRLRAQLATSGAQIAEASVNLAPAMQKSFTTTAASIHARSRTIAAAAAAAASSGSIWISLHANHILNLRNRSATKPSHALIVRQCAALVIFEPQRARLPAIRAG